MGIKPYAYSLCLLLILTIAICLVAGATYEPEAVVVDAPLASASRAGHVMMPPILIEPLVTEQPMEDPLDDLLVLLQLQASRGNNRVTEAENDDWEPDVVDVTALAQTLWGECRGCSELQKRAVCWCVFNRVDDSRFPDTVYGVVSQKSQFFGYKTTFPVDDALYELAYECMVDWHNGQNRVFDERFVFFTGNGRINIFTTEWGGGDVWAEE